MKRLFQAFLTYNPQPFSFLQKMSGLEEPEDLTIHTSSTPPTLPIALDRIAIGINFGALVIGLLFTIWALTVHGIGPVIGVLVFEVIATSAVGFIMIRRLRCLEPPA